MKEKNAYQSFLELAKQRRSIRKFKNDPLPEGAIEKIIDAARWAPSGFHTQPWEFIAVTDEKIRREIIKVLDQKSPPILNSNQSFSPNRGSFRDAPAMIFAMCDWRSYIGLPFKLDPEDPIVTSIFTSSMASVFVYMHLAVASLGLASQWYSASGRGESGDKIRSILGVPKDIRFYDLMFVGYEASPPAPKEVRAIESMLHYNVCDSSDFRTDDQIEKEMAITKAWCLSEH